jgi:hypothetical protein
MSTLTCLHRDSVLGCMKRKEMRSTKMASLRSQRRSPSPTAADLTPSLDCDPHLNRHEFDLVDLDEMEEDNSD